MENELVHNDAHATCCGQPAGECTCAKNEPEPKAPVINSEGPVGGGLGVPGWDFSSDSVGVVNYSRSVAPAPQEVTGPYALAGAGQDFGNGGKKPVTNAKANDALPAGGALGQPTWNF